MAANDLQKAVDALVMPARAKVLAQRKAADPLPAVTRSASAGAVAETRSGGGIASPLTEVADSRVYAATPVNFYSSDGLIQLQIYPASEIHMTDANGSAVVLELAP